MPNVLNPYIPLQQIKDRLGLVNKLLSLTMLRKQLFLILALALTLVPVLQAAHALTHVGEANVSDTPLGRHATDGNPVKSAIADDADSDADAGANVDSDIDRLCLDCLALTGFSIIFSILALVFLGQTGHQPRPYRKSRPLLLSFYAPYPTRGPPPQA